MSGVRQYSEPRRLDEFFAPYPDSRFIFDALSGMIARLGDVELRIGKSQVAFWRTKVFARVWIPQQYLRRPAAPLVLTLLFGHRDPSPRWKQVVEPVLGRFTHHLELYSPHEIDDQVLGWLKEAWATAG